MVRVTLVDSGTGNLFSLREAFSRAGAVVDVANDPAEVRTAECLVLPGVASFTSMVRGIREVRRAVLDRVDAGVPLLGICAGMQVLFESSQEGPGDGLGLLRGNIARLRAEIVPHMGWTPLELRPGAWFPRSSEGPMVYFAHSFAASPDAEGVVATADHGGPFAAAVRKDRLFGVQFHPEKSGQAGGAILRGFLTEAGVTSWA